MIIIDNYIKDDYLLDKITKDIYWENSKKFSWKDRNQKYQNVFEEICDKIWEEYDPNIDYEGYEYWTHSFKESGSNLGWHKDKDEHLSKTKNILVHPHCGCVYYAHKNIPQGGYLEIQWEDEIERIRAVPNRLIIFHPSNTHRVSEVTSGFRRTLVSNIWIKKSSEENFMDYDLQQDVGVVL